MSGESRGVTPTECPIQSAAALLAFWPGDATENHRIAWLYGIFLGWDDALDQVAEIHGWDDEAKARLERLHGRAMDMKEGASDER